MLRRNRHRRAGPASVHQHGRKRDTALTACRTLPLSLPAPAKQLLRREPVPTGNRRHRLATPAALGNDLRLLLRCPSAPPAGPREHLQPPHRLALRLGFVQKLSIRHVSNPLDVRGRHSLIQPAAAKVGNKDRLPCTYPKGKRPRRVEDGAIMFMGRLVYAPTDTIIFGRAVGLRHQDGRDDATPPDIELRPWKVKWPHYVRVYHREFIAGTLENGVSLRELMDALGSNSFEFTKRNAAKGSGNTNPRKALMQQAAVELSAEGFAWLNAKLEEAFTKFGKLPEADLSQLDQPSLTVGNPT